jgi:2-polyprenyl-3-methyl-5-hydroxy-6-metoxy-1,4-benzoquinol methylase
MATDKICPCCAGRSCSAWTQAEDVEYATTTGRYTYYRCEACHCLFIDPVPSDLLSTIYPADYYSYTESGSASVIQRVKDWLDARLFKRLLAKLQGPTLSVLDVGGGAGQQLSLLRRLDARIGHTQVVDLDAGAQAAAEARGHQYFRGPIESFQDRRAYDLILMLNIIEHVADPGAVLAKLRDLLSPQGKVLVKTPNIDSLDARIFRQRNWVGYHCPRHWVLFNFESFQRLCGTVGLQVEWHRYTQGAPFWAGSVIHFLSPKTGTAQGRYSRIVDHPLHGLLCAFFAAFDILRAPFSKPSQMFLLLGRQPPL